MSSGSRDGSAFQDHFSGVAPGYARYRPTYPDELFDFLADRAPGRSVAWDCGAGSGQASAALALRFRRVLASDLSASQLARRQARPNILYVLAPVECAPLASASVDLVVVAQALHWFPHTSFYSEVKRVLRPGGYFAAWCYTLMSIAPEVDAVIGAFYREIVGPYWPSRRALVDDGYRCLELPFQEVETPPFAMRADWDLERLVGYLHTWSAVRRYKERNASDPVDLIADDLAAAWGPGDPVRAVRWDLHVRAGRVP